MLTKFLFNSQITQKKFTRSRSTKETRYGIYSKLTIKIPGRRSSPRSGVFIVNFEYISHFFLVFLLLTSNTLMLVGKLSNNYFLDSRLDYILPRQYFLHQSLFHDPVHLLNLWPKEAKRFNCWNTWELVSN